MPERHYDRHIGVDHSGFDSALELTLRDPQTVTETRKVRIPAEDIPEFMAQVVRHGTYALAQAARRLEVGHCETCANTGLVDIVKHGRTTNARCPDCRHDWRTPFANAPVIGYAADQPPHVRMRPRPETPKEKE